MITAQQIKELREKTGAGISDIKLALEESGGDKEQALKIIERKLGDAAQKKLDRKTQVGLIDSYIHSNGRMGVLVEVFCETDFVARNPSFKSFAHDIAMHIAAMNPLYLSLNDVPKDLWEAEKSNFAKEAVTLSKPAHILKEIVDGKLKTHFGSLSLLSQPFIKDTDKNVGEVLNEAIGRFGENIKIGRFKRLEI